MYKHTQRPIAFPWTFALVAGTIAVLVAGCASPTPNRDPVGTRFPDVGGTALDGEAWRIPKDLEGAPAVILIGFVQDSQFDIDRWLLGIRQAQTPVAFLELPTIKGLAPAMFQEKIDEGMRGGIPSEDWRGVITLWRDDAQQIVELTGNTRPNNARVVLLDEEGKVAWFTDRGYSADQVLDLDQRARALLESAALPAG